MLKTRRMVKRRLILFVVLPDRRMSKNTFKSKHEFKMQEVGLFFIMPQQTLFVLQNDLQDRIL
jgi:hypothetical protein